MLDPLVRAVPVIDDPEHLGEHPLHRLIIHHQLFLHTVLGVTLSKRLERLVEQPDAEGEGQVDDNPDEEDVDEVLEHAEEADDDRADPLVEEEPSGGAEAVEDRPKRDQGDCFA